jgi:hypothetical protein
MNLPSIHKMPKFDYLILLPIMALAFYLVHIDEWVYLAYSKAMLGAGSTTFIDPFLGQATLGLSSNLEAGFQLFWGVFHQISGTPWLTIFRYFPSIIFMMTVLSVYILAHRQGFGWEAALFTCLIPTTVSILGPAFLVPVAMGLLFVPLSIFLAFNFRTVWSYLIVFIFTCFLLCIHPPSAVCLVIVLAPHILLSLRGSFKHSLGLTLAMAMTFLIPFPWIFDLLLPTARALLTPYPSIPVDLPQLIATYGYLPIVFCLLGAVVLELRGDRKDYSLILGLLAVLLMLVIFLVFHCGVPIVYERGLMYMMLMVSIVAAAGLMWVKNISLPGKLGIRLRTSVIRQNIGKILCLALVGLTLAICIPVRQSIPYYHLIDEQDYEAFVWIRDNVGDDYEKAILDPWKATAFTATTEKNIYARIHMGPSAESNQAYAFLEDGCRDTTFLRENGISIVYTRTVCSNPDLTKVSENIYLLKEAQ